MHKLSHVRELEALTATSSMPNEVIEAAKTVLTVLDNEYGADRDPLNDDGGYVVVLEPHDDVSVLIGLDELGEYVFSISPEYTDIIQTSAGVEYIHALILCNNEFSIHIFMTKSNAPVNLLDC